jgi:hypothetical protein
MSEKDKKASLLNDVLDLEMLLELNEEANENMFDLMPMKSIHRVSAPPCSSCCSCLAAFRSALSSMEALDASSSN